MADMAVGTHVNIKKCVDRPTSSGIAGYLWEGCGSMEAPSYERPARVHSSFQKRSARAGRSEAVRLWSFRRSPVRHVGMPVAPAFGPVTEHVASLTTWLDIAAPLVRRRVGKGQCAQSRGRDGVTGRRALPTSRRSGGLDAGP
jgi:hypothetical protein